MDQPTILLFNTSLIKTAQIASLCSALGIQAKQVTSADSGKTIAMLAGPSNEDSTSAKINNFPFPSGEMIVFCGLLPEKLDSFLVEFKKRGIPAIPLKAVMTPFNAGWTPGRLFTELSKEHAAFQNKKPF